MRKSLLPQKNASLICNIHTPPHVSARHYVLQPLFVCPSVRNVSPSVVSVRPSVVV